MTATDKARTYSMIRVSLPNFLSLLSCARDIRGIFHTVEVKDCKLTIRGTGRNSEYAGVCSPNMTGEPYGAVRLSRKTIFAINTIANYHGDRMTPFERYHAVVHFSISNDGQVILRISDRDENGRKYAQYVIGKTRAGKKIPLVNAAANGEDLLQEQHYVEHAPVPREWRWRK